MLTKGATNLSRDKLQITGNASARREHSPSWGLAFPVTNLKLSRFKLVATKGTSDASLLGKVPRLLKLECPCKKPSH